MFGIVISQKGEERCCCVLVIVTRILSIQECVVFSAVELSSCDSRGFSVLQHQPKKRRIDPSRSGESEQTEEGVEIDSKPRC
jgi:hypothetical protein